MVFRALLIPITLPAARIEITVTAIIVSKIEKPMSLREVFPDCPSTLALCVLVISISQIVKAIPCNWRNFVPIKRRCEAKYKKCG